MKILFILSRKMSKRCYTKYHEDLLKEEEATQLYEYLKDNIAWVEGVRSRRGFTRKAKALDLQDDFMVEEAVTMAVSALCKIDYRIDGVYLNYYEDGNMWTPNHRHQGTHQIVISLGAERSLMIGKKEFKMKNGSAIIFGGSVHGVPKQPEIQEGRISIATFMTPI